MMSAQGPLTWSLGPMGVTIRKLVIAAAAILVAALVLVFTISPRPRAVGPSHVEYGFVESVGPIAVGRARGATRAVASIRMPDGQLVTAHVLGDVSVPVGARVRVRVDRGSYEVESVVPLPGG